MQSEAASTALDTTSETGLATTLRAIKRRLLLVLAIGVCAFLAAILTVTQSHHIVPRGSTHKVPVNLSCPRDGVCVAVDDLGNTLGLHNNSWSAPHVRARNGLDSISCATVTFCVAVGVNGDAVTYDGRSWSAPRLIDRRAANYVDAFGTSGVSGVSCPSMTFCVAVDALGRALRLDGRSWSAPLPIEPAAIAADDLNHRVTGIVGISCSSSTFCGAITGLGRALTYDGHSWSTPVQIEPAHLQLQALQRGIPALTSVSCPSASRCVAVDSSGNAFTYNGTSWSELASIDPASASGDIDGGLTAVSCPSVSFCVGVDALGAAVMYDGTSWSQSTRLDVAMGIAAVSCANDSFCVALNNLGEALTYRDRAWSSPRVIDF